MLLPPVEVHREGADCTITLEAFEEDGRLVCGIFQLDGRIDLPPRKWLTAVREEVDKLEKIARAAGAHEMRIAGRDWSRVLRDYGPCEGVKNGLRKVL